MIKKVIYILVLGAGILFPQSAGNSGMAFLKFGIGARNVGMGDIGAMIANDASAPFYNPASLASNNNPEVMMMHNQWIEDIKSEILGAKFALFGVPLAVGVNMTNIGNIEIRTKPGEAIEKFDAHYLALAVSSGFNVIDNFDFGFSVKYLYEGLYVDEATGYAFDFGARYQTPVKGLTASAVIRNLGGMENLRDEKTKLPTDLRIGAAYNLKLDESYYFCAGAEFQKYLPTDDAHINIGTEVVYNNLVSARVGYQSGYTAKWFVTGFGLIWGNLNFDYSFSPLKYQMGTGHSVSLNFKF
jgi:hypothetical protein